MPQLKFTRGRQTSHLLIIIKLLDRNLFIPAPFISLIDHFSLLWHLLFFGLALILTDLAFFLARLSNVPVFGL